MSQMLAGQAGAELVTSPRLARLPGAALRLMVGIVLCLTPITAVIVLGWLMRLMRREIAIAAVRLPGNLGRNRAIAALARSPEFGHLAHWPGWLGTGDERVSGPWRWFAGLAANVRQGLATTITLGLATLPFGLFLLFSWWAGWENSFNKGYEQAWVGPIMALAGIALALMVLSHLPLTLAHQAAEERIAAFFAIGTVRRLMRMVRWRHVVLALATVVAALPLTAAKVLPAFIEAWRPGFAGLSSQAVAQTALRWQIGASIYLMFALVLLRRAAARVYARAALKVPTQVGGFVERVRVAVVPGSPYAVAADGSAAMRLAAAVLATLTLAVVWFGFIAQIYVAQFINHRWFDWLNYPLISLPWIPRLG
jgi:hypothetical protein